MRKIFNYFAIAAVASFAFASCTTLQEELITPEDNFVYTFRIVGENDLTKSIIGNEAIEWQGGEALGLYHNGSDNRKVNVTVDGSVVTFQLATGTEITTTESINVYSPYVNKGTTPTAVELSIPSDQNQGATGFDATAMPMASIPFNLDAATSDSEKNVATVKMCNLGSIVKLNVYGTTGTYSTEKIQSVTLTAATNLAGTFTYNLTAVALSDGKVNAANPDITANTSTSVTTTLTEQPAVPTGKANATPVYFVVAPGTHEITVKVVTDSHSYTKTVSSKTFVRNGLKTWNLDIETANCEEPAKVTYTKVTETSQITDGKYLIVYEDGPLAFDGSLTTLDAVSNTKAVTIVDNAIEVLVSADNFYFTIAPNSTNWTIQSASGYYIGNTSNANALITSNSTSYANTLTIEDNSAKIVSSSAVLRYNSDSNQHRFRYFKSSTYTGQKVIQLYKLNDTRAEAGMSWSVTEASATVGDEFSAPVFTQGNATSVTYSSSNTDVADIDSNSGVVTIKAAGTTIISAIFTGDENYKPATVSYTLTVTDRRTFSISIGTFANGTVTSNAADNSAVNPGTTVTLTIAPSDGYALDAISVTDSDDQTVELTYVDATHKSFTMPASNVTVSATFAEAGAGGGTENTSTITCSQVSSTTSYSSTENTFILDEIQYGYKNAMINNSNGTPKGWAKQQVIQTKNGSIYNKDSLGSISKIRVYTVDNTNTFTVYSGNSSEPEGNSVTRPTSSTGTETVTYTSYVSKVTTEGQSATANYYDFDIDNYPYFKISFGSSALYIYKIEVTYAK